MVEVPVRGANLQEIGMVSGKWSMNRGLFAPFDVTKPRQQPAPAPATTVAAALQQPTKKKIRKEKEKHCRKENAKLDQKTKDDAVITVLSCASKAKRKPSQIYVISPKPRSQIQVMNV